MHFYRFTTENDGFQNGTQFRPSKPYIERVGLPEVPIPRERLGCGHVDRLPTGGNNSPRRDGELDKLR